MAEDQQMRLDHDLTLATVMTTMMTTENTPARAQQGDTGQTQSGIYHGRNAVQESQIKTEKTPARAQQGAPLSNRGPISDESRELRFINEVREDQVRCLFCNQPLPKAYVAIQEHIDAFHKPITTKAEREAAGITMN